MKAVHFVALIVLSSSLSQCIVSKIEKKVTDKIENFPLEHQAKDDGRMDRVKGRPESYTSHSDHYTPATEAQYAKAYHEGYFFGRSVVKKVARAAVIHHL